MNQSSQDDERGKQVDGGPKKKSLTWWAITFPIAIVVIVVMLGLIAYFQTGS